MFDELCNTNISEILKWTRLHWGATESYRVGAGAQGICSCLNWIVIIIIVLCGEEKRLTQSIYIWRHIRMGKYSVENDKCVLYSFRMSRI